MYYSLSNLFILLLLYTVTTILQFLGTGSTSNSAELLRIIRSCPLRASYTLQRVSSAAQAQRSVSHPFFAHMLEQLIHVVDAVVETQPLLLGECFGVWKVLHIRTTRNPCVLVLC